MKLSIAIILVIIAMCNAEPPRFGPFQRQTAESDAAPYAPRGWRPQGAAFSLPQQNYGAPPQTYGAPPQAYGPPIDNSPPEDAEVMTTTEPATTTEIETEATTDEPKAERLTDIRKSGKLENADVNPVYLVVPQKQNFVYTFQRSEPLLAAPQTVFLTSSKLQALPVSGAIAASIYTPYGSYVQIYQ